jgi:hypothetical protein
MARTCVRGAAQAGRIRGGPPAPPSGGHTAEADRRAPWRLGFNCPRVDTGHRADSGTGSTKPDRPARTEKPGGDREVRSNVVRAEPGAEALLSAGGPQTSKGRGGFARSGLHALLGRGCEGAQLGQVLQLRYPNGPILQAVPVGVLLRPGREVPTFAACLPRQRPNPAAGRGALAPRAGPLRDLCAEAFRQSAPNFQQWIQAGQASVWRRHALRLRHAHRPTHIRSDPGVRGFEEPRWLDGPPRPRSR